MLSGGVLTVQPLTPMQRDPSSTTVRFQVVQFNSGKKPKVAFGSLNAKVHAGHGCCLAV